MAQEWGLTFPLLLDQDGTANRLYEVQSLPSTYFIDSQGIVQNVVLAGPMSEALLRIKVQKLLKLHPEVDPLMLPILHIGPLAMPTPALVLLVSIWIGLEVAERWVGSAGCVCEAYPAGGFDLQPDSCRSGGGHDRGTPVVYPAI